ncbi:hypothetical protein ABBQ32_001833 [Trebouxia sp. C0010 RCD-2024]
MAEWEDEDAAQHDPLQDTLDLTEDDLALSMEEQCHRAMVTKALEQTMALISPKNAFLGRKQVNLIAEKRPRTLEAFLSMSLHGLSKHMRTTHGPAIIETLRQVEELMEIQRSEGIFREEFELDKALIQSLTHSSAAATDFQAGQGGPSKRIMPASMRTTDTPPSAGQPARNSGGFQAFRYSAEKAQDGQNGGLTPQLQTRMPVAHTGAAAGQQQQGGTVNGFVQQRQQQLRPGGGPLQPCNGQQTSVPWKAPWQQEVSKPIQHRSSGGAPSNVPWKSKIRTPSRQHGQHANDVQTSDVSMADAYGGGT